MLGACDKREKNSVLKQGNNAASIPAAPAITPFSSSSSPYWVIDFLSFHLWNTTYETINGIINKVNKATNFIVDDKEGKISKLITAGALFFALDFALGLLPKVSSKPKKPTSILITSRVAGATSLIVGNIIGNNKELLSLNWKEYIVGLAGSAFSFFNKYLKNGQLNNDMLNRAIFSLPIIASSMNAVSPENAAAFYTSYMHFHQLAV